METQTNIRASEEALFSRWQQQYPNVFVPDGVVDELSYQAAPLKVLFLLKEVNDEDGTSWDLREFLKSSRYPQTWNNVARWSFGLLSQPRFAPWSSLPEQCGDQFRVQWLKSVAVVNVKKVGGGPSSHPTTLREFVENNRESLHQQLLLYRPDVTVCCGTTEYPSIILSPDEIGKWQQTSNGIWYARIKTLGITISYYHPQAHYPANFLYTMLINSVEEVLRNTKA